ncbi:hypothetical protein P3T40_008200 [Paraburkholderia sp. EB58]|uniref:hypothetical protein n=1 Tax=Paraburkholderia sp. EB58 TaxID=3035125 RepID=UPI003D231E7D
MKQTRLILVSGSDAQENAVGEIVHSDAGGSLARVDKPRKTPAQPEPDVFRVRTTQLAHFYCTRAAAHDPCTAVVSAQAVPAMLDFLEEHTGTVGDFASIVCTVTPDPASQQTVADTLTRLSSMGAAPQNLAVVFTQAPRAISVQEAFAQLAAHIASGRFPAISYEAVLYQSKVFERARDLQLPIGAMLRGEVDFGISLEQARQAGEPDHLLHELARKLLAQRALIGCKAEIDQALEALRMPGTSTCIPLSSPEESVPAATEQVPTLEHENLYAQTSESGSEPFSY